MALQFGIVGVEGVKENTRQCNWQDNKANIVALTVVLVAV